MERKAVTATADLSSGDARESHAGRASRFGLVELRSGAPPALDFDELYDAHFDFVWRSLLLRGRFDRETVRPRESDGSRGE